MISNLRNLLDTHICASIHVWILFFRIYLSPFSNSYTYMLCLLSNNNPYHNVLLLCTELMPILSRNFHCNYTRTGASDCLGSIIWFVLYFNSTSISTTYTHTSMYMLNETKQKKLVNIIPIVCIQ